MDHWTTVPFGKYIGLTLPQIAFRDPDYLFWACRKGIFYGDLERELHDVATKASHIRVLPDGNEERLIEYIIDRHSAKFVTAEFVYARSGIGFLRSRVINLEFPRLCKEYDKLGNKNLVAVAKEHLFGDRSTRMTRDLAGSFFSSDDHFLLE
jgi:uncharacterized protein (DUF3820 family)